MPKQEMAPNFENQEQPLDLEGGIKKWKEIGDRFSFNAAFAEQFIEQARERGKTPESSGYESKYAVLFDTQKIAELEKTLNEYDKALTSLTHDLSKKEKGGMTLGDMRHQIGRKIPHEIYDRIVFVEEKDKYIEGLEK